jgi:hypothetical protein
MLVVQQARLAVTEATVARRDSRRTSLRPARIPRRPASPLFDILNPPSRHSLKVSIANPSVANQDTSSTTVMRCRPSP